MTEIHSLWFSASFKIPGTALKKWPNILTKQRLRMIALDALHSQNTMICIHVIIELKLLNTDTIMKQFTKPWNWLVAVMNSIW